MYTAAHLVRKDTLSRQNPKMILHLHIPCTAEAVFCRAVDNVLPEGMETVVTCTWCCRHRLLVKFIPIGVSLSTVFRASLPR